MNSLKSLDQPPLQPPPTPTQNTLPTAGAVLGSVLGSVLASKLNLDPVMGGSTVAGVTALLTAFFHFLASKLGVPQ
jgi:hypothetical protein